MKKRFVVIEGKFPTMNEFIDANRVAKGRWNNGNQMKQRDQKIMVAQIKRQLKNLRIKNPVYLKYRFYEENRRRDLDNISGYFHKVFQDALVTAGILKDDSWNYIVGFSDEFEVDKKEPRIEIEICEVEGNNGKKRSNI